MKIFVTGGTGFVGSHFLNAAFQSGHTVLALRRAVTIAPRFPIQREPEWLESELGNVQPSQIAGCDVLVHLAAHSANVPYDTLENCLLHNVLSPLALLRAAYAAGVKRIVVAGSCFEYGRAGERYEFIPPDAPLEPTQTYPASKAAASIAFSQLAVELGLELSIHRIFQVFGEGEAESRLWPSLRRAALAGEDLKMTPAEQIRDFVPVEEVARQLLAACSLPVLPGQPLVRNLGTGRPEALRDFAARWWAHWKASGQLLFGATPYRSGEVMRFVPEIEKSELSALSRGVI
jgi:nucleoside-diphosphate-sugar epimerase